MATQRFPIRIGGRSRGLVRIFFGATPETAWAEVDADGLRARFGRFHFETPLANIATWRIEGPFRWIKAIGIRTSVRHRDRSFGGSPHGGVRMDFREPVGSGPLAVPAFYVGVDDLEGFAAALTALGIPGEDARRPYAMTADPRARHIGPVAMWVIDPPRAPVCVPRDEPRPKPRPAGPARP